MYKRNDHFKADTSEIEALIERQTPDLASRGFQDNGTLKTNESLYLTLAR
jgi:hypothetical protein